MRSVFYGTKGTIICDNTSPAIQLFETNEELGTKYSGDPQQLPVVINNHNATEEIRMFVEALVNGDKMPISSAEGAYTVAVCRAALTSVKSGKPEAVKYPET
jgi:predicted dehydrogenase